jgi:VWFA-related protein
VIYAVMLFDADNHDARPGVLKALARETGGTAFQPKRAQDMMAVFTQIALEIRSGYTIGFSPPNGSHDGFRSVRVIVADRDQHPLTARTRGGYVAGRIRQVE